MKLWLITQTVNTGFETFEGAVVAAQTEEEARRTHPNDDYIAGQWIGCDPNDESWAELPEQVTVRYLGKATSDVVAGVILSSYWNA